MLQLISFAIRDRLRIFIECMTAVCRRPPSAATAMSIASMASRTRATGMIGQGVLRECLLDPGVDEVLAVGRHATGQQHVARAFAHFLTREAPQ